MFYPQQQFTSLSGRDMQPLATLAYVRAVCTHVRPGVCRYRSGRSRCWKWCARLYRRTCASTHQQDQPTQQQPCEPPDTLFPSTEACIDKLRQRREELNQATNLPKRLSISLPLLQASTAASTARRQQVLVMAAAAAAAAGGERRRRPATLPPAPFFVCVCVCGARGSTSSSSSGGGGDGV